MGAGDMEVQNMEVRELKECEVRPALELIWDVFLKDVAPSYTQEGIDTFRRELDCESFLRMYKERQITMFGAFEGQELAGTISVKNIGHIFMFYVKSSCQGRGAGRQLFEAVKRHCIQTLKTNRITVNAAPGAVPKYIHMGMQPTGPEQMADGICYTPMEMTV